MLVEDYLPLQHQHQGCIPAHHAALPAVLCTLRCFLQGMMKSMDPEQLAKMMSASGMKVTPEQVGMGGGLGAGAWGMQGWWVRCSLQVFLKNSRKLTQAVKSQRRRKLLNNSIGGDNSSMWNSLGPPEHPPPPADPRCACWAAGQEDGGLHGQPE